MKITGTAIPLGKINNAKVPWGINNDHVEINRLVKQMEGKPIKMCTEAFVNQTGSHACDLDTRATVGTITQVTYNPLTKNIDYEGEITHDATVAGISNGTIEKKTSPHVISEFQDDAGMLHQVDFECLTITKNPAFQESVFNVSYIAEEGDGEEASDQEDDKEDESDASPPEEKKPRRSLKGVTTPKEEEKDDNTIVISPEDLEKMIEERIAKATKKEEPKKVPMTKEEFDALYEQRREDERKEDAINEYKVVSHSLGFEVEGDNLDAMKNLDSKTIKAMTSNLRKLKDKIPEKKEEDNKPMYYNPQNGTGGFNGIGEMTVGYKDDNGNWVTKP